MDTYKVGTVANSESTMHTIMKSPFSKEMFAIDNSILDDIDKFEFNEGAIIDGTIDLLNALRDAWFIMDDGEKLNDINKEYYKGQKSLIWNSIIKILPCSYMQKRTWTANYSILRALSHQREGHRLTEWSEFREKMIALPYANELIFYKGDR